MLPAEYSIIADGLKALLKEAKPSSDPASQKLAAMLDIYLARNADMYSLDDQERLRDALEAMIFKFHAVNLALEQLWALGHARRAELTRSDRATPLDEDQLVLLVFVLECFLFQARAFLDVFMRFTCLVLRAGDLDRMSEDGFFRQLQRVINAPFADKAQRVREYFREKVYGDGKWYGLNQNNWGRTLSSLRNLVAHRNRIRLSFDASEQMLGGGVFDWPTIAGIPYDRFCQYTQNGIFALVTDLTPVLFDLEWKAGHYRLDMWEE